MSLPVLGDITTILGWGNSVDMLDFAILIGMKLELGQNSWQLMAVGGGCQPEVIWHFHSEKIKPRGIL